MINNIETFVLYHPYTITGLYVFLGVILGFSIQYFIKILAAIISKVSNKNITKSVIKVIKNYPIIFFTFWGIYRAIMRVIGTGAIYNGLKKFNLIFSTYILCIIILRTILEIIRIKTNKKDSSISSTSIIENIVRAIGVIVIIFIILTELDIPITPILTALGVGGIAVALAFQDILSNLFSGIFVIASSQIRPGDFVKIDATVEGFIADISWRNTTIRDWKGNYTYVPNSKIANATIVNCMHPNNETNFVVPFSVSYDSDLSFVENIVTEEALKLQQTHLGAVKTHIPVMRVNSFGNSAIDCKVVLRACTFSDQYSLSSDFIKILHERFKQEGIDIPFPITTLKTYDNSPIGIAPSGTLNILNEALKINEQNTSNEINN
ncbi:MAG: mechanosensitive ion channel [Clostridiales bacterium]|nr:mechanosensitive ion channel [Clostridiales bacterium]